MTRARTGNRGAIAGTPGRTSGFTLIEMAIAMLVIALILGAMLVPLVTQVEERQVSDTEKTLQEIREALIGYAVANGYLPCPDKVTAGGAGVAVPPNVANDGVEDVNTLGTCSEASQGNVPWVTLGLGASDVWGNRFRYQVSAAFAQRPATFNLSSAATISVCTLQGCTTATSYLTNSVTTPGEGAVAIVISLGKNGYGAINAATGTANPAPTSNEEIENQAGPSIFASRTRTPAGSLAGEFDDVVVWISKYTLFNRMVAAGKLP